jgi:hypothetical protein
MMNIEERIKKGVTSILREKEKGRDTSAWEEHILQLLDELKTTRVRVKIGQFGFCTCILSSGLCSGCWKIAKSCKCVEIEVDPEQEITEQYAKHSRGVH